MLAYQLTIIPAYWPTLLPAKDNNERANRIAAPAGKKD